MATSNGALPPLSKLSSTTRSCKKHNSITICPETTYSPKWVYHSRPKHGDGRPAHDQDLQYIVSATCLELPALRCRPWLEWISTKLNLADGISRDGPQDQRSVDRGLWVQPLQLPEWLPSMAPSPALWAAAFAGPRSPSS